MYRYINKINSKDSEEKNKMRTETEMIDDT